MRKIWKAALSIFVILFVLFKISEAAKTAIFGFGSNRFNPKFFSQFNISSKDNAIYLDMTVAKPLDVGLKASMEFQLRLDNSNKYQTLFAITLDVCQMISSLKVGLFQKWFESFLKYSNFMQSCPVATGHYYVNGWKLSPDLIPPFLHPGDYNFRAYCFRGKYKTKSEIFVLDCNVSTLIEEV